jgi:pimeloyl-ACP methyl ester carboxylesterase
VGRRLELERRHPTPAEVGLQCYGAAIPPNIFGQRCRPIARSAGAAERPAWIPQDDYVNHFAFDVDPVQAKVMYATQQPLAASAFGTVMGDPAWKSFPSWYLVATKDQAIPPDAERSMAKRMNATTVEVASSHVAMVSHPDEVANLIMTAAKAPVSMH